MQTLEIPYVHAEGEIRIELHAFPVGKEGIGSQRFPEHGEGGAQRHARLLVRRVSPEERGELFTRMPRWIEMQDEIGEERFYFVARQAYRARRIAIALFEIEGSKEVERKFVVRAHKTGHR